MESFSARARSDLRASREALAETTGGAPSRQVLAQLARDLASELAEYFDDLPMSRFTGKLARGTGLLALLLPSRRLPHRVVAGRYLHTSVPSPVGSGLTRSMARIAVLAIGSDGELRSGIINEAVVLSESKPATTDLISWDDARMRGVPSRTLSLQPWHSATDAVQVAAPAEVLTLLAGTAQSVAAASNRDLALLERFR